MPGQTRELRKARRKPRRQAAWIRFGDTPDLSPCVIWDLTEGGARLACARLDNLPEVFTLNLTKDGTSARLCRLVWRKKPHVGVQFLDAAQAAELEARRARGRYAGAAAGYPAGPKGGTPAPLALHLQALNGRAGAAPGNRGTLSTLAFGLLLLLFVATAVFYVAGMQVGEGNLVEGSSWANDVCGYARDFCENPEWSGVPAVLVGFVFLMVKRMEQ